MGKINKVVASPLAFTNPTVTWLSDTKATCILALTNGNFLVGTGDGSVIECDSDLNAVRKVTLYRGIVAIDDGGTMDITRSVGALSESNGIVVASAPDGILYKIHWPTGTILERMPTIHSHYGRTLVMCAASSGETFVGYPANSFTGDQTSINASWGELDFTTSPMNYRDVLRSNYTAPTVATGLIGDLGWAALGATSNNIIVATITPRTTSSVASDIQDPSSTQGRIIRIVDNGVGQAYVETDTAISAASESFPTTSGKSIIELAVHGEGTDERGSVSLYTT
jgi:hypothetical protein